MSTVSTSDSCYRIMRLLSSVCLGLIACGQAVGDEVTPQSLLQAYIETIDQRHEGVASALSVFKTGQFGPARELLETATAADPALPPAGILLTRMFIAAGKPKLARQELERVIEEHPQDPEGFLGICEVAIGDQRFANAELALKKSMDLAKTKQVSAYRQKKMIQRFRLASAALAEHREDWGAVSRHLQSVIDEDIDQPDVVMRLARSLVRGGDPDGANALLTKHWQRDEKNVRRPEITLALLHQESGNRQAAAALMKQAAGIAQGDPTTQSVVATWALEQGELELARECADRAMTQSNASIRARLLAALVDRYQGQYADARATLESVHLESPANLGAVIELAIVLREIEGQENLSLQYAQVATKLQPNLQLPSGRDAAMALAWVLNKFGGQAKAQEIVRQILAAGPVGVESSYFAATILLPSKDRSAAKQLLTSALASGRVFPGHADAQALLSQTAW